MAKYKEIFVYQEQERQVRIAPDFDQLILKAMEGEEQIPERSWGQWIKVAVILLLFLGGYQVFVEVRGVHINSGMFFFSGVDL